MNRFILVCVALLLPVAANAQQVMHAHTPDMAHHHMERQQTPPLALPTEAGQSAFATIQEIVSLLTADPNTDWSKVNIEKLRRHLIDMSNVTLYAKVTAEPLDTGARFTVTGEGAVRDSIRRMVTAHSATMTGTNGWTFSSANHNEGAVMTVTASDPNDVVKIRALGFIGVMTLGMHHQQHHLMIASGMAPHE